MKKYILIAMGLLCLGGFAGCGDSADDFPQPQPQPRPQPQPDPQPINPIARLAPYMLAASLSGGIEVFRVDTASGNLTEVAGSPFAANAVEALEVHPNQRLVYGGVDKQGLLEGLSLDPVSGSLTRLVGFPVATVVDGNPEFSPSGEFLYVVGDDDIDGFRVNPDSGAAVRLAGFPFDVPGMTRAQTHEFGPTGQFLYVADRGSNQVFVFNHNPATGGLALSGQVPSGAAEPTGIGVEPGGRFAYVSHLDGTLTGFAVNANGSLTALANAPTVFGTAPAASFEFAFREGVLFIGANDQLNAFQVGNDGSLVGVAGYPRSGGGGAVLEYPLPAIDLLYSSVLGTDRIHGFRVNAANFANELPTSPYSTSDQPGELVPAIPVF